jgi:CubicO group peptidase (beta-lactamase class C family)
MTSLLAATLLFGQTKSPLDTVLDQLLAENKIPGAVIEVRLSGKSSYRRAVGFANLETRTKMSMESVHELASVSKQFTAAAVMAMVEQGKLSLNDTVDRFVDQAPKEWKNVTVEMLLHHTSGLPDYLDMFVDLGARVTPKIVIDRLKGKKMQFEPGAKWEYSNTGYMLLGHIVDQVSGESFHDVVRKHIFLRAGMKSAVISDPGMILKNRAFGYSLGKSGFKNEDLCSAGYSGLGDGMVSASAADLMAWHDSMRLGKVLRAESWKFLWTPSAQSIANKSPYGGGVGIVREGAKPLLSHSGGWLGTTTFFVSDTKSDHALIILINGDGVPLKPLLDAVKRQYPMFF